eukprot:751026-Pyramimonas_sp.AAC.1
MTAGAPSRGFRARPARQVGGGADGGRVVSGSQAPRHYSYPQLRGATHHQNGRRCGWGSGGWNR